MDTHSVQYARTSDGFSIAYTDSGEGRPLVFLPFGFCHAQMSWRAPLVAPLMRRLERRFRLIRYDGRGQGLSQRGLPADTSLDSFQADLQAIIDRLHLERPILLADHAWSHVAVRHAARHPEQLSGLILMRCQPTFEAIDHWLIPMMRDDWDYYLRIQLPDDVPLEQVPGAIRFMKTTVTQADVIRITTAFAASDIEELLPRLQVPALILNPSNQPAKPFLLSHDMAARVAALIPNGRLAVLNRSGLWGDPDEAVAAIEAFVRDLSPWRVAADTEEHRLLSARELEVLHLVAAGRSNAQISEALVISPSTVAKHVSSILAKTGTGNRAEATAYAHRRNLL